MSGETAYRNPGQRLVHRYGDQVHVLSDPWALSALARLGHPDTQGLLFHSLLESCYRRLLQAACEQLPTVPSLVETRMAATEPRAVVEAALVDPNHPVIVVDIARAGMIPAAVLQRGLFEIMDPAAIRVDHIYMQRLADDSGRVVGVRTDGSKIGGPVDGATVLVPDPMAATGASVSWVLDLYRSRLQGTPAKLVVCHLIVTPEYLRRLRDEHPDVHVYALRLDRGLSDPDVLATIPGTRWDEERGLNAHDYIVPGAGGLGEVINNCWES